ncbi:MAG TPA: hypothetical protein PLN38_15095 [Chitinophagales bacterium]|nr:hypothetical protein [Chitinophagales bacterium]
MALEYTAPPPPAPTPPFTITGTPYYIAMFNAAGDNVDDTNVFRNIAAGADTIEFKSPDRTETPFAFACNDVLNDSTFSGQLTYGAFRFNSGSTGFGMRLEIDSGTSGGIFLQSRVDTQVPEIDLFDYQHTKHAYLKNNNGLTIDGGSGVPLKWPLADGTANQVMKTDAAGNLGFYSPTFAGAGDMQNAKYITGIYPSLASGNNDLYTVPAGKRALISAGTNIYNNTGGAINCYRQIKVSGSYYRISATTSATANALTLVNSSIPIILEAGESIVINAASTGCTAHQLIIEFDNTSTYKSPKILSLANGDNTLYQVPANYMAFLPTPNTGAGVQLTPSLCVFNSSGGLRTYVLYNVKSGQAVSNTYKFAGGTAADLSIYQPITGSTFGDGDKIVLNTDAAGNQVAWCNIYEKPV